MILIFQLEISRLVCICWHSFFLIDTLTCVSYIIMYIKSICIVNAFPFKNVRIAFSYEVFKANMLKITSVLLKLFINGNERCHTTDPLPHSRFPLP